MENLEGTNIEISLGSQELNIWETNWENKLELIAIPHDKIAEFLNIINRLTSPQTENKG